MNQEYYNQFTNTTPNSQTPNGNMPNNQVNNEASQYTVDFKPNPAPVQPEVNLNSQPVAPVYVEPVMQTAQPQPVQSVSSVEMQQVSPNNQEPATAPTTNDEVNPNLQNLSKDIRKIDEKEIAPDGLKFIGIIFAVLIIFVILLPYISKLLK